MTPDYTSNKASLLVGRENSRLDPVDSRAAPGVFPSTLELLVVLPHTRFQPANTPTLPYTPSPLNLEPEPLPLTRSSTWYMPGDHRHRFAGHRQTHARWASGEGKRGGDVRIDPYLSTSYSLLDTALASLPYAQSSMAAQTRSRPGIDAGFLAVPKARFFWWNAPAGVE